MISQPVIVTRRLKAPIERVYAAWTHADFLKEWFAPGHFAIAEVEADARPGGAYRIAMIDDENDRLVVFGNYERLSPPNLIEFTWQWEQSSNEKGVSLVTVELTADGTETELKLIHTKLSSPHSEELHSHGWNSVLDRFTAYMAP